MNKVAQFSDLKGKILTKIDGKQGDSLLYFECSDGTKYQMYHYQDCCESVRLEEVAGDFADLIGLPLIQAEESSNENYKTPEYPDSWTWTFYRLATANGQVVLRWLGESNGYYSESVDFEQI